MDSIETIVKYFPDLNETQILQFEKLKPLFLEWNEKINLISRKDTLNLYEHHILHSLGIAKVVKFLPGSKILDIGTGGGFPGIPLAILYPEAEFILVDSIAKKIKVVNDLSLKLNLKNIRAFQTRAENVNNKFDFVISRAVTRLNRFIPWTKNKFKKENRHLLKNGILYLKGGDLSEEIKEAGRRCVVYPLSTYFNEPFFETKKVVYIPSN